MRYYHLRTILVFIAFILLFGCDNSDGDTNEEVINIMSVSLNKTILSIVSGQTETLVANIKPENATNKNVIWLSSDDKIAIVDGRGMITAIKAGETKITVTTEDGKHTAICSVTVIEPTVSVSGVTLNQSTLSILTGQTETLTAIVTPSNATNKDVTWVSSDDKVATVNGIGVITAVKAGEAKITATTVDRAQKATCNVTVTDPIVSVTGISLNKSTTSIQLGKTENLIATVTPADATNKNITWTSSNDQIATVSSAGLVTAKSIGTATITVTTADGAKKSACSITVTEPIIAVTGIFLNKTTTSIQLGKTENLIATIVPTNATNKDVTWTSNDAKVATVSSTGVVTVKSIGTATITVTTVDSKKTASCYIKVVTNGDLDDFNYGKM